MPFGLRPGMGFNNPGVVIANEVIIIGSDDGLYVYNGTPFLGNPPILSISNSTEDPYGNTITPSLSLAGLPQLFYAGAPALGNLIGSISATGGIDEQGNSYVAGAQIGVASGNQVQLLPSATGQSGVASQITITEAINGVFAAVANLTTVDASEMLGGVLASAILDNGSSAKITTVLTSPVGSGSGMALILAAENDGGTDTAWSMLGTITTPDDETLVFTPVMWIAPYAMVLYSSASGVTVITKTAVGSGNLTGLPATVKAEAWGGDGGGGTAANFGAAAGGGGGYDVNTALATNSGAVSYVVGAAGTGGVNGGSPSTNGGNSTVTGLSATVTGGGGEKGTSTASPGTGGTGTYTGGNGGSTIGGYANGGGGGGKAGNEGPGGNGTVGRQYANGEGGDAGNGTGGSKGGSGGKNGQNGQDGGAGGGSGAGGNGGNGTPGFIRVTYSTGGPGILASIAAGPITDPFGTSIPAGTVLAGPGDSNQYNSGPFTQQLASALLIDTTGFTQTPFTFTVAAGETYRLRGKLSWIAHQSAGTPKFQLSGTATITSMGIVASNYALTSSVQSVVAALLTALNQVFTLPAMTSGDGYVLDLDGSFVVDVGGTITIQAATSATADTYTLQPNSTFAEITPVIAT